MFSWSDTILLGGLVCTTIAAAHYWLTAEDLLSENRALAVKVALISKKGQSARVVEAPASVPTLVNVSVPAGGEVRIIHAAGRRGRKAAPRGPHGQFAKLQDRKDGWA